MLGTVGPEWDPPARQPALGLTEEEDAGRVSWVGETAVLKIGYIGALSSA